MTQFLRAEAQPLVRWDSMYETQQKAFRDIVLMLSEAVSQLPTENTKTSNNEDDDDWLVEKRSSQLAFLSGSRGTGKTSVMASLCKACSYRSKPEDIVGFPPELVSEMNDLRSRLVWLEPLDMEVSTNSSNLLAAILARIEATARPMTSSSRSKGPSTNEWGGMLDNEYRDPLMELQRFQTNMSIAWDTDLEARRPQLDPDNLAVESMRFEKSRLSLVRNLDRVLNGFGSTGVRSNSKATNPMFVLPVDDFDLCPPSCLELLRLLRMISVPRLFFLVLGDLKVADLVLNLKFSADLASVANGVLFSDFFAIQPKEVAAAASEVTANAIRKLIPPALRVALSHPTLLEALNFRPINQKSEDKRLFKLLAECPVYASKQVSKKREHTENLLTRILPAAIHVDAQQTSLSSELLGGFRSGAISLLSLSSRSLTDLWYRLNRLIQQTPKPASGQSNDDREKWNQTLCAFVGQLCGECWTQDPGVPVEQRRDPPSIFESLPSSIWSFDSLWVEVNSSSNRAVTIESQMVTSLGEPEFVDTSVSVEINLNRVNNWSFNVRSGSKSSGTNAASRTPLLPNTTGSLILFHDLTIDRQESASLLLRSEEFRSQWAVTTWCRGLTRVELPWPLVTVSRFASLDSFLWDWNQFLSRPELELHGDLSIAAFTWIDLGSSLLGTSKKRGIPAELVHDLPWGDLFARLTKLAVNDHRDSYSSRRKRDWLCKVGSMLMPEMGLSLWGLEIPPDLAKFWFDERMSVIGWREKRLAQLVAFGLGDVANELQHQTLMHLTPMYSDMFWPREEVIQSLAQGMRYSLHVDNEINPEDEARRIIVSKRSNSDSSRPPRKS